MLSAAGPATATPADKSVVIIGALRAWNSGAVTPDSWRTYIAVPVGGYNFTPGGNVYVTFQDPTPGTATPQRRVDGGRQRPLRPRVQQRRQDQLHPHAQLAVRDGVRARAVHVGLGPQSPQEGYGWSYRDTTIAC
jgi:hypothetical protein